MPPTPFPSKRVMRAYRKWNGWPEPPRVIHVDELAAWIDRAKKLTSRGQVCYNDSDNPLARVYKKD